MTINQWNNLYILAQLAIKANKDFTFALKAGMTHGIKSEEDANGMAGLLCLCYNVPQGSGGRIYGHYYAGKWGVGFTITKEKSALANDVDAAKKFYQYHMSAAYGVKAKAKGKVSKVDEKEAIVKHAKQTVVRQRCESSMKGNSMKAFQWPSTAGFAAQHKAAQKRARKQGKVGTVVYWPIEFGVAYAGTAWRECAGAEEAVKCFFDAPWGEADQATLICQWRQIVSAPSEHFIERDHLLKLAKMGFNT